MISDLYDLFTAMLNDEITSDEFTMKVREACNGDNLLTSATFNYLYIQKMKSLAFKFLRELLIRICNGKLDITWEQFDKLVEDATKNELISTEQRNWLLAQEDEED